MAFFHLKKSILICLGLCLNLVHKSRLLVNWELWYDKSGTCILQGVEKVRGRRDGDSKIWDKKRSGDLFEKYPALFPLFQWSHFVVRKFCGLFIDYKFFGTTANVGTWQVKQIIHELSTTNSQNRNMRLKIPVIVKCINRVDWDQYRILFVCS